MKKYPEMKDALLQEKNINTVAVFCKLLN